MIRVACFVLLLTVALAAQPAEPKFEVVAIRPVPADAPVVMREATFSAIQPGGQYVDSRASLFGMIAFAYNVKNPSMALTGLPNWAKSQSFAVSAKAPEGFPNLPPAENREQVRLMVRAMLEDRFHLKVHSETRQERVFDLEVAKGGIKIKEVEPPVPPATGSRGAAMGDDRGRMIGKKTTMDEMAGTLVVFLHRQVVNRTGLTGYYDYDIHWNALDTGGGPPPSPSLGAEGIALLISNLESQLGLRLAPATGPVEYWVVDHIEPPTEN